MSLSATLRRAARLRFFHALRLARPTYFLPVLSKHHGLRARPPTVRLVVVIVIPLLALLTLAATLRTFLFSGQDAPQLALIADVHAKPPVPDPRDLGGAAPLADPKTRAVRPDARSIAVVRTLWPSRNVTGPLTDELWNEVKNDVVIGIKTGHEVARERLRKLRSFGWWSLGRDVPNLLVISDSDCKQLGTISARMYGMDLLRSLEKEPLRNGNSSQGTGGSGGAVRGGNGGGAGGSAGMPSHWFEKTGWKGDKDKNLPALHLLRTVYPNKKWYLLLDDDTYIFLENFARYILQEGMDDTPIYTGKVFYISRCGGFSRDGHFLANKSAPRGMFAHGGSGIVLNGRAMEAMFPTITRCIRDFSSCWAGDMQVGLCLRRLGIMVRRIGPKRAFEKHFAPFRPSKALADRRYSARWKGDGEPLTFHQIPDEEMRLMSDLERKRIASGDPVVYSELREYLLENGVMPAHTRHDRANKHFSDEFLPDYLK